jgi:hypothetical protein
LVLDQPVTARGIAMATICRSFDVAIGDKKLLKITELATVVGNFGDEMHRYITSGYTLLIGC